MSNHLEELLGLPPRAEGGFGARVERTIEEVMLRPGGRAAAQMLARFRLALLAALVTLLGWFTLRWPLAGSTTLVMCVVDAVVLLVTLGLYAAGRLLSGRWIQRTLVGVFALDLALELVGLMSSGLTHSTIVVIPLFTIMTAAVVVGVRPAIFLAVAFSVAYPVCAVLVASGRWPFPSELGRTELLFLGGGQLATFAVAQELFFALVLAPFLVLVARLRRAYQAYQRRLDAAAGRIEHEVRERESEREDAAKKLRAREQAYRLLADHVTDLVVLCDADGRLGFVSPSATAVIGHDPNDLVGKTLSDLVHPDDWPDLDAQLGEAGPGARPGAVPTACEHRLRHRDGAWRWVETRCGAMPGPPEGPGGVILSSRDVTARREAAAQLRESEARFRALVESMDDAVLTVDREVRLTSMSGRALAREATTAAAVLGQKPSDHFGPEIGALLTQNVELALAGGHATFEWTLPPERGPWRGGSSAAARPLPREMHTKVSPLRDVKGEVTGAVLVSRDVTELRTLQERLLLSERMTSMGTLAAGVAHEINNPLAAVMANVEHALEVVGADEIGASDRRELTAVLRDSAEAAERVRQIVQTLKTFSRPDESRREHVELARVLEAALDLASNEIRHRARVVRNMAPAPLVLANEARLGQVFINLLVNAAQAIPAGHAEGNTITLASGTDETGRAFVEVVDTGAGIAPDVLPRIFDPFFTTKPIGVGTGLGLSICHRIVGEFGGAIAVSSAPGQGTCFRVSLPPAVAENAQPDVAAPASAAPRATSLSPDSLAAPTAPFASVASETLPASATAGLAGQRRGRILIIDDDPLVLRALTRLLKLRHEVVALGAGAEALARVRGGESFDVVLCDVMMPDLTGVEVYKELLRLRPELAARVVFLTGGAFADGAREFLEQVSNSRLEKPLDFNELTEIVARLLDLDAPASNR